MYGFHYGNQTSGGKKYTLIYLFHLLMQDKPFTYKERRTPITHSLIKGYSLKKTLDHHTKYQLMKKIIFKILIFVLQTHI